MSFSGTKGYKTKPKPGVRINPAHPLSRGLVGCWLLNEGSGSQPNDISGYRNKGLIYNMSPNAQGEGWGDSISGGGLWFSGSNRVTCDSSDSLDITGELTVSAWIKLSTVGKWQTFVAKGQEATFQARITSADYLHFKVFQDGVTLQELNCTALGKLSAGVWYHVAYVFIPNVELRCYLNGRSTSTAATLSGIESNAEVFSIGARGVAGNMSQEFEGVIDAVHLYDCALSAFNINQLYHDPFGNLIRPPIRRYYVPAAGPAGAIMNQLQKCNIGADLYNGALIA